MCGTINKSNINYQENEMKKINGLRAVIIIVVLISLCSCEKNQNNYQNTASSTENSKKDYLINCNINGLDVSAFEYYDDELKTYICEWNFIGNYGVVYECFGTTLSDMIDYGDSQFSNFLDAGNSYRLVYGVCVPEETASIRVDGKKVYSKSFSFEYEGNKITMDFWYISVNAGSDYKVTGWGTNNYSVKGVKKSDN
jgi:hypothetical protein